MNKFISTFNSGITTIEEETTHASPEEYLVWRFGSQFAFENMGGSKVEMHTPPEIVSTPAPVKKTKKKEVTEE
jgi:hypothetical protein